MKQLYKVRTEIYVLNSKPIQKGSITECINGYSLDENNNFVTRPVHNLEAVLVVNPHPLAGRNFQFENGEPIRVIGVRETDSFERLSVWREGFVDHPEYHSLCTSAHASGLIPLEAYQRMMENIKTADDVVELKKMINKYFDVVC